MKNELLLSTIFLLNPVSSVSANEIGSVKRRVIQGMQYLADMAFHSEIVKSGQFWRWNDETQESEEFEASYRVRVTFLISRSVERSDYYYNGSLGNSQMDYEALIERIDSDSGEVLSREDSTFFAKRLGKNKFRIYDCSSTSNCWDREETPMSHADMYVFETPKGRILKTTKNSTHYFDDYLFEDKVLVEIP
jgi:hypothetical protein